MYGHLVSRRIIWKFITEPAPCAGDTWERLVRSVKTALKTTMHRSLLKADEMMSMLCEVELQINARPFTFVGEDLSDEEPLIPFHFLHGRPPEVNTTVEKNDPGTPAFAAELTKQRICRYVIGPKRMDSRKTSPSVGDIVIVAESDVPRIRWRLGRMVEMFPSSDGLIRTVRERTPNGDLNGPVQRLHLLESAVEQ
ncbi:hypothetical protein TTRE_0000723001 [Trichuris trichiura]|uniref:DUF5641 domain-containing protein n=1 Tax=Trichuris trichiura TaxID=36087 RepID=A0A077ZGH0_TRITR|nr:hypothetical protein TTRE_0000723001 [Trichuris trichiura]